MITVGQLKALLSKFPDDLPVIMSEDAEGNGFSPLAAVSRGTYLPYNTWSGEAYPTRDVIRTQDPDYYPEADDPDLLDAVFLDPVN